MRIAALLAATTVSIAAASFDARAQSPYYYQQQPAPAGYYVVQAPPPIGRVHDGGFYGRLQLGGGYSLSNYPSEDLRWSGGAFDFSMSLGLSLPNALALHLDFLASATGHVDVTSGGTTTTSDVSYGTGGFGIGATYYFPSNAFVTGGLGFAVASLTADDGTPVAESDIGGYLTLGAGREWWLGRRFAIGFYGRLSLFSFPDSGVDARFTTVLPAIGLSMSVD